MIRADQKEKGLWREVFLKPVEQMACKTLAKHHGAVAVTERC